MCFKLNDYTQRLHRRIVFFKIFTRVTYCYGIIRFILANNRNVKLKKTDEQQNQTMCFDFKAFW